MSSYSLPARYQSYLGRSFLARQLSNVSDALPGVLKRGLSTTPKAPVGPNPGLPDVSEIDQPKTPWGMYAGIGVGAVLLLALVGRRKRA